MTIETDRLIIDHLDLSDAPFILRLVNTPGWIEHIGDRNIHELQAAERYIQEGPLSSYARHGFGLWAMRLKSENKRSIGICGLLQREYLDYPDLGFAILPEYEGRGLTLEASRSVLDFANNQLKRSSIMAITSPENKPSIALLQKLGFTFKDVRREEDDLNIFQIELK